MALYATRGYRVRQADPRRRVLCGVAEAVSIKPRCVCPWPCTATWRDVRSTSRPPRGRSTSDRFTQVGCGAPNPVWGGRPSPPIPGRHAGAANGCPGHFRTVLSTSCASLALRRSPQGRTCTAPTVVSKQSSRPRCVGGLTQARADRTHAKTGPTTADRAELARLRKDNRSQRDEREISRGNRDLLREAPALRVPFIEAEEGRTFDRQVVSVPERHAQRVLRVAASRGVDAGQDGPALAHGIATGKAAHSSRSARVGRPGKPQVRRVAAPV